MAFTRWGRTACPTTAGTQQLYQGKMAGSAHNEAGSADYLCLHNQPQFLQITTGLQEQHAKLYGTEYQTHSTPAFRDKLYHDAPCSVCYTPERVTKITIPGRTSCPPSWTREYYGYLMASGRFAHHHSRAAVCVDVQIETIPGSAAQSVKSLLHFLEMTCTETLCPPYSTGWEITCVVCTI